MYLFRLSIDIEILCGRVEKKKCLFVYDLFIFCKIDFDFFNVFDVFCDNYIINLRVIMEIIIHWIFYLILRNLSKWIYDL